MAGEIPCCSLRAILTELEGVWLVWLGPGAGGAHVATRLVLAPEGLHDARVGTGPGDDLGEALDRTPPTGWVVVVWEIFVLCLALVAHAVGILIEREVTRLTAKRADPSRLVEDLTSGFSFHIGARRKSSGLLRILLQNQLQSLAVERLDHMLPEACGIGLGDILLVAPARLGKENGMFCLR